MREAVGIDKAQFLATKFCMMSTIHQIWGDPFHLRETVQANQPDEDYWRITNLMAARSR